MSGTVTYLEAAFLDTREEQGWRDAQRKQPAPAHRPGIFDEAVGIRVQARGEGPEHAEGEQIVEEIAKRQVEEQRK